MSKVKKLMKDLDTLQVGEGIEFCYDAEWDLIFTNQLEKTFHPQWNNSFEGNDVHITYEDGYYVWSVTGHSEKFSNREDLIIHMEDWFSE
jgi:hypothetical protein